MSPNWGVSLKRGCPRLTLSPCDLAPGGQKLPTCWGRLWAWFAVPLGPHPWHTTHNLPLFQHLPSADNQPGQPDPPSASPVRARTQPGPSPLSPLGLVTPDRGHPMRDRPSPCPPLPTGWRCYWVVWGDFLGEGPGVPDPG